MRTSRSAAATFVSASLVALPALVFSACGGGDDVHAGPTADGGGTIPTVGVKDGGGDVTVADQASPPSHGMDAEADVFTDADAGAAPDADRDAHADSEAGPPAGPPVCGDGWRDEATEECDDGDAGSTCSSDCRVIDVAIVSSSADAATIERSLGPGPHSIAAHDADFAATVMTKDTGVVSLALHPFTARGVRPPAVPFSGGSTPIETSNPVLAALPNGKYAVAWTDTNGDGDGQGVALRAVDPNAGTAGALLHANTTTLVTQHAPDIVWTGSALFVAWTDDSNLADGADIKMRAFDRNLAEIAPEYPLAATADVEADVSLCAFEGSWAATWRSFANGDETVHVQTAAGLSWSIGPFSPGPTDAPPSLIELDATHLLVAFTDTIESSDGGQASTTRVRLAVLDTAASTTTPVDLAPTSSIAQASPRLAMVAGRAFITWWAGASPGNTNGEEISLAEVVWNTGSPLLIRPSVPLPRAHRSGDQRVPSLAVMNGAPDGNLVTAWDDLGRSLGSGQSNHDAVVEVIPIPILRLDGDGGP